MFSDRVRIATLTLDEVRSLPPLASGYETDRVFRLTRQEPGSGINWSLAEEQLGRRITKVYDDGTDACWLESYQDAGPADALRFIGAVQGRVVKGVVTWMVTDWNSSLWLVDIRVRAESRGTGVGSALMKHLVEHCRKERLRGIFVETQIRNYPAICFYRRHGFAISGFNDHLYTNHDLAHQDVAVFLYREV
jgi:ribosomal protein S18 acetylase RimI-like enzyme